MSGKKLINKTYLPKDESINISKLTKGVYLITLISDGKFFVEKFVKI